MYKKGIFPLYILMVFSFSAGVFTEAASPGGIRLSVVSPSLLAGLFGYLKDDFLTVLLVMLFSASFFLFPLAVLIISLKTFSMGFTAAYLLPRIRSPGGAPLLAALVPRAFIRVTGYILLISLGFRTAVFVKGIIKSRTGIKKARYYLYSYIVIFFALFASAFIEIFLLRKAL